MSGCSIEDCTNPHRSLGYCTKHYRAFKAHGDPLADKLRTQGLTCKIEECNNKPSAKNLCQMHYVRSLRYGDPLQSGVAERKKRIAPEYVKSKYEGIVELYVTQQWQSLIDRCEKLCSKVQYPHIDTLCWEWPTARTKTYPGITKKLDGKLWRVSCHRMILEASLGRLLHAKMHAHHKCANNLCVNPDHLEEATTQANTAEMKARNYFIARIQELEEENQALKEKLLCLTTP